MERIYSATYGQNGEFLRIHFWAENKSLAQDHAEYMARVEPDLSDWRLLRVDRAQAAGVEKFGVFEKLEE